jgi:hypothetical protein
MKKRKVLSVFAAIALAVSCIILPPSVKTGFDVQAGAATYDNVINDGGISISNISRNSKDIAFAGELMEGDIVTLAIEIPALEINLEHFFLLINYNKDIFSLTKWYRNHDTSVTEKATTDEEGAALTSSGWEDIWEVFSARNGASTYDRTNGWIKAEIGASGNIYYSGLRDSGIDLEATFTVKSGLDANYNTLINDLFEIVLAGEDRTTAYFFDEANNYVDSQDASGHVDVWIPAETAIDATIVEQEHIVSFTVYTCAPTATTKALSNTDIVVYQRNADGSIKKDGAGEPIKDTIDLYSVDSAEYNLGTIFFTGTIEDALNNITTNPFEITINPVGGAAIDYADKTFMFDLKQWCKYAKKVGSTYKYYNDYFDQTGITLSQNATTKVVSASPNNVYIWLYGDVDHNGEIAAVDATLILKYVVGMSGSGIGDATATDETQKYKRQIADVTEDGEVNARDATQILRKIVGLPSVFDNHPKGA